MEAGEFNWNRLIINRPTAVNIHAALCESPLLCTTLQCCNITRKWRASESRLLGKNPELVDKLPVFTCLSLKYILSGLGLKKINLWILDAEGTEVSTLLALL